MRIVFFTMLLFVLSGCDTLGEIIREKKYTVQVHETPNTKQEFGYNNDQHYVGFMMSGRFGAIIHKHEHSDFCAHNIEKNPE